MPVIPCQIPISQTKTQFVTVWQEYLILALHTSKCGNLLEVNEQILGIDAH